MRRTFLLKSMLLLCALVAGSSSVWADDPIYTLSFTKNTSASSYTTSSTQTSSNVSWTVYANCSLGNYIRVGGKNTTNTDRTLTSSSVLSSTKAIGKVVINHSGTGTGTNTVITINSIKVEGSTSSSFPANSTKSKVISNPSVSSSGDLEFTLNNDSWDANSYFRITVNYVTAKANSSVNSGPNNSYITINNVKFYESTSTLSAPTFSPEAGAVAKGTTVTLTQNDADQIRYTINGVAPTKTTGTIYSDPIVINAPTTIKAIAVKGEEVSGVSEATYTVVYPAVVTLDFTDDGWGFPTEYETSEKSYKNCGYTINLGEGSTGHKVMKDSQTNDLIALIFGKKDATLTLPAFGFNVSKIKIYGNSSASAKITFNIYVGANAVSTEATSSQTDHEFAIDANYQTVGTIYTIKLTNANNCQISKIEVFGNGCEAREVTSFGWATYVAQNDMKFPAGRAYVVTNASVGNAITKAEVTDVPAGTPVLLKDEGAVTAMLLDAAPAAPATNMLSVCDGTIASGKYAWVLAKNGTSAGFKQWTGEAADLTNRVVMLLDEAAGAPSFIPLDGETTGINTVNGSGFMVNGSEVYNLNGQRVARPTKGLYIVNGRKVVIK